MIRARSEKIVRLKGPVKDHMPYVVTGSVLLAESGIVSATTLSRGRGGHLLIRMANVTSQPFELTRNAMIGTAFRASESTICEVPVMLSCQSPPAAAAAKKGPRHRAS